MVRYYFEGIESLRRSTIFVDALSKVSTSNCQKERDGIATKIRRAVVRFETLVMLSRWRPYRIGRRSAIRCYSAVLVRSVGSRSDVASQWQLTCFLWRFQRVAACASPGSGISFSSQSDTRRSSHSLLRGHSRRTGSFQQT
jgi:hypothetical protein